MTNSLPLSVSLFQTAKIKIQSELCQLNEQLCRCCLLGFSRVTNRLQNAKMNQSYSKTKLIKKPNRSVA